MCLIRSCKIADPKIAILTYDLVLHCPLGYRGNQESSPKNPHLKVMRRGFMERRQLSLNVMDLHSLMLEKFVRDKVQRSSLLSEKLSRINEKVDNILLSLVTIASTR